MATSNIFVIYTPEDFNKIENYVKDCFDILLKTYNWVDKYNIRLVQTYYREELPANNWDTNTGSFLIVDIDITEKAINYGSSARITLYDRQIIDIIKKIDGQIVGNKVFMSAYLANNKKFVIEVNKIIMRQIFGLLQVRELPY